MQSACFNCNTTCEALIFVDEASGRVLKVEGDPESPITKGVLCSKGLAAKDLVHNPERLQYPLRRVGERGGRQWERISWDQALSTIAEKLLQYREQYGPQGIAFLEGTRRGWSRVYSRLANAFGAVNHGAAGWAQCLWPRLVDNTITFGGQYMEAADYEHTNCMLGLAGKLHKDSAPTMCQHCDQPACLDACPTEAIYRETDGTVQIDSDSCNGCATCREPCSFGTLEEFVVEGRMVKCTLCFQRRQEAGVPSCAQHCLGRVFTMTTQSELETVIAGRHRWSCGRIVYVSSKWAGLGDELSPAAH